MTSMLLPVRSYYLEHSNEGLTLELPRRSLKAMVNVERKAHRLKVERRQSEVVGKDACMEER